MKSYQTTCKICKVIINFDKTDISREEEKLNPMANDRLSAKDTTQKVRYVFCDCCCNKNILHKL